MYSSAVSSSTARSSSPEPVAGPAPPPMRPQSDEDEASENAKTLIHATKDRPRRKVRLPSRKQRFDPPAIPLFPMELMVESEVRVIPDLPPPPPPESSPPQTSPTLLNSATVSPHAKMPLPMSSPSISSQGIPATNISVEAADPISSFTKHLKKIRENSASMNNSRVTPMSRVGDVFLANRRVFEYKPHAEKTTIAKPFSNPGSNNSSLLWEGNSSHKSQESSVQSISPKTHRFRKFQSNIISKGPLCPNSLQGHAEVGIKTGSSNVRESLSASGLEVKDDLEVATGSFDEHFPPVLPFHDFSPPESRQHLPTPGVQNGADTKPRTPKVASHNPIGYHTLHPRKWSEVWQQRSNFLDDKMSEPLPLLILSKVTENNKETPTAAHTGTQSSPSDSISNIPDYPPPPPMVPDYPPPMVPDKLEVGEAFEIKLSEKPSSGTKTLSPQRIPALNQELSTSTLSGLISGSATKKTNHPSPLAFPHFPILPPASLSPVSPFKSLPNLNNNIEALSTDSSSKVLSAHRATRVHIRNICKESKDSPPRLPVVEDDTGVPSFETTSSIFPVIHPKLSSPRSRDNPNFGKQINSSTAPLALPSMMDQHHNMVKVIQESVPISPDLKFTRVAKKTWKKPNHLREDDLSSSSSTGNVVQGTGLDPEAVDHQTPSLQCSDSSDSILQNERQSHIQFLKLSPLAENGVSPVAGSSIDDKPPQLLSSSLDGDNETQVQKRREQFPETESFADCTCASKEQKPKITSHLKRGRQANIKRVTQLDSNMLDQAEPEEWSSEQVCQWLDYVGLDSFKQAFKKKKVNGFTLLHMDIKLFAELGIEGHKIREIFLAKIYELSKPSSNARGMEDNLWLSADTKNKDWRKMKAALNDLKSPVNEAVMLEPSPTGELPHIQLQWTSDLDSAKKDTKLDMESHFHYQSPIPLAADQAYFGPISKTAHKFGEVREHESPHSRPRRAGKNGVLNMEEIHSRDCHGSQPSTRADPANLGKSMISQWISELPDLGTHTEPDIPPDSNLKEDTSSSSSKACVYPCFIPPCPPPMLPSQRPVDQSMPNLSGKRKPLVGGQVNSPNQLSTSQVHARTSEKCSAPSPFVLSHSPSNGISLTSPLSFSVSLPESTLVKIYMNKVQEGSLYKSFLATSLTTVDDIVAQALVKANMSDQNPTNYSIMEISSESSQFLERFHAVVDSMNRHAHDKNYRLELRYSEELNMSKTTTPSVDNMKRVETENSKKKSARKKETIHAQIHQLEKNNSELCKDLDYLKLQLLNHQELKGQLSQLQKEHSNLDKKYHEEQSGHKKTVQHLEEQLDNVVLTRRKIEEDLVVLKATAEAAGATIQTTTLLEQIQEKYTKEMSSLTSELRVKDRSLREMRKKRADLEDEVSCLHENMKMADESAHQLVQCNMRIHSLERECASKEDMIQKITLEKERDKKFAEQNVTLQKTLQTLELNAKKQQDISKRTVRELGQRLDQLALENAQKDQQAQNLRKEVNRLFREKKTKDVLMTSLEADLASYKMFQTPTSSMSLHVQNLQRSASSHEVAMASLNKEVKKLNEELLAAQQDMAKLQAILDKKEECLASTINHTDSDNQRSSLFSTLTRNSAHSLISACHSLITAHIKRPSRHEGDSAEMTMKARVGIKVATAPGDIRGCVIVKANEHVQTVGLQPGDRVLEVNDLDVTTKSAREMGELLQRHFLSPEGLKLVVTRLLIPDEGEDDTPMTATMVEKYKNLSSTLSVRLESQNVEMDHWRQEYSRFKAEILKCSTSQKEKETEINSLQSTVQALKQQLEHAERSVKLLKLTVEKLEGSVDKQAYQQSLEMMENTLKERNKDVSTMKVAEKARIAEFKKMKEDKDKAVMTMRQYIVNTENLKVILPHYRTERESLTKFTRAQMVTAIHGLEEDLAHHKAYLDQLLTIIIDQNPELLSMISEAQKIRDKMDDDNWC